jgi:hypothetical protein
MEVRRLLTALRLLHEDLSELQIPEKLTALHAAAQGVLSSPSDAAVNETFFKAGSALRETLPTALVNTAPGSIRLALREAELESLTGAKLLAELVSILEATPFLLPRAAQGIQKLNAQVTTDVRRLNAAIAALEALNFSAEDTTRTQYEIGVIMPTSVVKDDLRVVAGELEEWIYAIDRIQELVDGQPSPTIPVMGMSTGSLDLFCGFHATGTEAFLILTLGVYKIFDVIRDRQRRRKESQDMGYPEVVIVAMKKHEEDLLEKGKTEIVKKLLEKKSDKLPKHRDLEIESHLAHVVKFVLKRVNEGVDIEVSTPPAAEAERAEAEAEVRELQQKIEMMRLDMAKISGSLPDRSTPLLQLPDLPQETESRTQESSEDSGKPPRSHKKKE